MGNSILLILFFVVVASFFCLLFIDRKLGIIIKKYMDVEVERLTNNIVNKAVHEALSNKKYDNLLIIVEKQDNSKISYDTTKINLLKEKITKEVQDTLIHLDDGIMEDYFIPKRVRKGRFRHIRRGVLCDVSLSSIRNSALFGNVGPSIPIKLVFSGQIESDVKVVTKEYGINNIMVELFLIMKIKEQVTMPLSSKRRNIIVKEPLSIDIIKGDVPSYYNALK